MRARVRAAPVVSATLAALLLQTSWLRIAPAEPVSNPKSAARPARLVPPKLLSEPTIVYPEALISRGLTADVQLQLDIYAEGTVTHAEVVTSAGAEFDQAAIAAGYGLRFAPATRDERPIPARIPFRISFSAPAPDSKGAATSTIVPEAHAVGTEAPGSQPPAPEGSTPTPPGEAVVTPANLDAGGLAPTATTEVQEMRVAGERPAREPTRRVLQAREFRRVPGANGDPLRVIESLPGVARSPGLSGMLLVRGSGPSDTNVFLDGTWIPAAYHFGGLTSVVPADVLSRIEFVPGNYGPEYGRGTGGIVELGLRSPRADRLGGLVQVDLLDGRFMVEAPLGKRARVLVAGRRSWIDSWFGPLMRETGLEIQAAPVYYDGQAVLEVDLGAHTKARLAAFGADDRFAIVNPAPSETDPAAGGALDLGVSFTRLQGRIDSELSERTKLSQMLSYGTNFSRFRLGSMRTEEHIGIGEARTDVRHKLARGVTAFGGLDLQVASYDVSLLVPGGHDERDEGGDGVESPIYGARMRKLDGHGSMFRPAAYVGFDLRPGAGLHLVPSVRVDYADDTRRTKVDPRLSARWDVVRGQPADENGALRLRTTLKAGVGIYRRPPNPSESLPPWGQSGLNVPRSFQASLGVEQELAPGIDVSIEGFAKWLDTLVVTEDAVSTSANGVRYGNSGQGRILGGELLVRIHPRGRLFGWLAYTLSRSERRHDSTSGWQSFQYDQTHILSALAGYDLGRGWEIGARYRLVSGDLYTPYVGGTLDLDAGVYAPVGAKEPFSARMPLFHRMDVRVDKKFQFSHWKLTAYLDIQNVYSNRSPELATYNYTYTQSSVLRGMPILPIIGLRGEL